MSRDARPFPAKSMAAMVEASKEEIHQGKEKWGLFVLLGLFTGFRKRVLLHFTDDWLQETANGYEIHLPRSVECTIEPDGGCDYCNKDRSRGDDGFLRPKTSQGEQRTVPVPTTWGDTYNEETRETGLAEFLDHYFAFNDTFQVNRQNACAAVWRVAQRRHKDIRDNHQGEVKRWVGNSKETVPDVQVHDLRASWCGQMLRMKVDETTIMDWGGWKNPRMINHYRSFIGDPTGSERKKVEGGGMNTTSTSAEKIEKLKQIGVIDDSQKHSAEKLAKLEEILS
jgi:hypothetical protein